MVFDHETDDGKIWRLPIFYLRQVDRPWRNLQILQLTLGNVTL